DISTTAAAPCAERERIGAASPLAGAREPGRPSGSRGGTKALRTAPLDGPAQRRIRGMACVFRPLAVSRIVPVRQNVPPRPTRIAFASQLVRVQDAGRFQRTRAPRHRSKIADVGRHAACWSGDGPSGRVPARPGKSSFVPKDSRANETARVSRAWRSGSARAHGSIGAALLAVAVGLAHAATALAGPSGTLDPSFGGTGIVTVPVGHLDDFAFALALQPDGRIVAAGSSAASDDDFLALRLRADGTLDPSFAAGGVRTFDLAGGFERARAVALDGDGRIVLAGFSRVTSGEDFAVARLLADGTPDATFGTGGVVITSIGPFDDRAAGVVVQPDGRIIAAGYTKSTANRDVALVRYESDGRLDATFGAGGIAIAA